MQQSQYFYAENSLWSYFSTKSFFMHQISRIYSHKFGLYLRYTVIVQHFTALCSKLGIFMNRTHRDSISHLKLHLFPNFRSFVPICHLSLYGDPLKSCTIRPPLLWLGRCSHPQIFFRLAAISG